MKIKFASPLFGYSGYAVDGRIMGHALLSLQPATSIARAWPDYPTAVYDRSLLSRTLSVEKMERYDVSIINGEPKNFPHPADGEILVRRMSFETGGLPKEWIRILNRHDQVWVMSHFNRATFIQAGVKEERIRVIPGSICSTEVQDYDHVSEFEASESEEPANFRILSIFRWQRRKGWDILTKAFLQEFAPSENVSLVLKIDSFSGLGKPDLSALLKWTTNLGYRDGHPRRISVITDVFHRHGLMQLYRSADCFVLPSRGEGWGLPYMEAMSNGIPTVGTNWGGNLDFMNSLNSYLIDYTLTSVEPSDIREQSLYRGQTWAEPSVDHLRQIMRNIFDNRVESQQKARLGLQDIREHFHQGNMRNAIKSALGL